MGRKKIRSLVAFTLLMTLLLAGGIGLRNYFLGRIREEVQSAVNLERIRFRLFPPSLIIDNIQTLPGGPLFSAHQIRVRLPLLSLFKREKPLTLIIEEPVVRVIPGAETGAERKKLAFPLGLPFVLEKSYLRGGELDYRSPGLTLQATGIRAFIQKKGDRILVKAESRDISLQLGPERRSLQGRVQLQLEQRGDQVEVKKFVLSGPDVIIKAKGRLSDIQNPQGSLRIIFKAQLNGLADILNLPFEWEGRGEGEGELVRAQKEITYTTSFHSDNLLLNKVSLGETKGRVEYRPQQGFRVALDFQREGMARTKVLITSEVGRIRGEWKNFPLDPVLSYFSLPWPIHSPAWGKLVLDEKQLAVDLEFKEETLLQSGERFPLRGLGRLTWDRKRGLTFSFPRLETSFGQIEIQGRMTVGRDVDFQISGNYQDIRTAREFVSLVLGKKLGFPEVKGEGHVDAHISGPYALPRVRLDFGLAPASFAQFDMSSGRGFVEVLPGKVLGFALFDDSSYRGEISFMSEAQELRVDVKLVDGAADKILPRLGLNFPLKGRASGHFRVEKRGESLRVEGAFSGPRMKFGLAELQEARGKIIWNDGILSFPELVFNLHGGRINSAFSLNIPDRQLEIDATAENINLSNIHPRLEGQLLLRVRGKGLLGSEVASGQFGVASFTYPPLRKADAAGELRLILDDHSLGVKVQGNLKPGDNDFSFETRIPFSAKDISLSGKGSFANLEMLLPWKGARGKLNYIVAIQGLPHTPRLEGGVDFEGPIFPFPRFAQALTDYAGLVFVQNNKASLRSFKAKLGGGSLKGSGECQFGKHGIDNLRLTLDGENMVLSPVERVRAQTDASLTLLKDQSQFLLEGSFDVRRLSWRREIFEGLKFSTSPYPQPEKEPGLFDNLTLNLRLKANDDAWMENSLGKIRGRFDLTVIGSVKAPILLGEMEALSGEAYFQDRRFEVLRGRVSFFNPAMIEPYLNFFCETYVKDYRVTLSLTGLPSQLKPEFSSSPPLPPEDVLALLALGEAFRRPYSTETSSQISTASLLSFQLTEEAQRRAEKLFSLDRFRIDPFLMGTTAEMTARLTLGKKISRDFYIYYSTNLTRQMEEIIRLEWDLGNEFSLVGTRNELGRVSLDFKIRKRF